MGILDTSIYYVDASRVATNWSAAVSSGAATTNIYRLVVTDVHEQISLWHASGDAVSSAEVTAAQAETTGGSVAAVVKKESQFGPRQGTEAFRKLAGVSGSVTLNAAGGDIFQLTLTGNVTAFDISTKGGAGRLIEVQFVQDGTGSRTLAGVNSSIKLAGGALTLTTGAGKRDVLRFRNVGGGVLVEIGRSLNL